MQKNTNNPRKLSIEIKLFIGIDSVVPIWIFKKEKRYIGVIIFGINPHVRARRAWGKYLNHIRWRKKNENINKKQG